jgi:hypothetical protein
MDGTLGHLERVVKGGEVDWFVDRAGLRTAWFVGG